MNLQKEKLPFVGTSYRKRRHRESSVRDKVYFNNCLLPRKLILATLCILVFQCSFSLDKRKRKHMVLAFVHNKDLKTRIRISHYKGPSHQQRSETQKTQRRAKGKHDENDDSERWEEKLNITRIEEGCITPAGSPASNSSVPSEIELQLLQRLSQLESLVASQQVQIRKMAQQHRELTKTTEAMVAFMRLLEAAGVKKAKGKTDEDDDGDDDDIDDDVDDLQDFPTDSSETVVESFEDVNIFGSAPGTVLEAADVAGASILAGLLAGKRRMLVDVRDAELQSSAETFVQFLELAALPVAAGLEGLQGPRNRLKLVFPTVSSLLQYRKTMCLSAPEVVALSTLGFDPVEKQDNMVIIIAPSPDDTEGIAKMNELLALPSDDGENTKGIAQPVVVLNHHMVPIAGPAADFEVAYHLRLLSVQYMSGGPRVPPGNIENDTNTTQIADNSGNSTTREKELEAALKHAREQKDRTTYGVTRAMVIRAYPNPWNIFVDTAPDDTTTDFEVAAVFDREPKTAEIHHAIVSCLEGSEQEDELVAQQMQQALESGQLDRVSELLSQVMGEEELDWDIGDDDDDDDDDPYKDLFGEDSV